MNKRIEICFALLTLLGGLSETKANEWHAEFRRAVLVAETEPTRLKKALEKNGFEVLTLTTSTRNDGARFQAFLDAIPTNGFAFIYLESIDPDAADGPVIPFLDSFIPLMEMARQFHSVQQKFANVNRHTASRQNVVLIEDSRLDAKTLQGYHRTISGYGANHTLAAIRKTDSEANLADLAADWLEDLDAETLRQLLASHASLNAEPFEPIQLKGTAASAISPPEQFRGGVNAGDHWISPGGHVMIWCPPGKFIMGDEEFEDAQPAEVDIERGFWINKYEFPRGMGPMPHSFPYDNPAKNSTKNRLTQPHFNVGNYGGMDGLIERYIDPIPAPEGWSWDLPTEAEWEYACRAGSKEAYPCEWKDLGQYANFADKSLYDDRFGVGYFRQIPATGPIHFTFAYQGSDDGKSHEFADIGSYKPNAWGIHDMLGNLAELCAGYYHPERMTLVNYEDARQEILRGGAWCHPPSYLHAAFRNMSGTVSSSNRYVGFRPVLRQGPRLTLKRAERSAGK